jgi:uncharacterized membrane protein
MRVLAIAFGLAYPVLIYAGLSYFEPRTVALALGAGVLIRVVSIARAREGVSVGRLLMAPCAVAVVLVVTAFVNTGRVFLFVPALINAALLVSFAHTLRRGPSMIETFARLQVEDDLEEAEVAYAVSLTRVWCVFFFFNGLVAVALAVEASVAVWAFYTGFLSYILMGTLFSIEFLYRTWRFRRYVGGPLNPLLERVFPPHPAREPDLGSQDPKP